MDVSSLVGSSCVCMSSLQGKKIAILANGVRRRLRASKIQEDNEDKGLEAESEDETLMDFM